MPRIICLNQAEHHLSKFIASTRLARHSSTALERTSRLSELVGQPERSLKVIHIAGTSGKSSTAYYLTRLLNIAGFKTGLTISPHIDKVTERLQLNLEPINDSKFCYYLGILIDKAEKAQIKPTYFELLYILAMWLFAIEKVDYAVVETGIGGLCDATNVMKRTDKVCLLTDIGYGHSRHLGEKLSDIVSHKVGIVHPGNHLLMQPQSNEIMAIVKDQVANAGAILSLVSKSIASEYWPPNLASFQIRNWQLAHSAYKHLKVRDGLVDLTLNQLRESYVAPIVGRLESHKLGNQTLILDGAHNGQKMSALAEAIRELYPGQKPSLLLCAKSSQLSEYQSLFDISEDVIMTSLKADWQTAFRQLVDRPGQLLVVTGSLYLVAGIRAQFSHFLQDSKPEPISV